MRKTLATAALVAAGVLVFGMAGTANATNSGAFAGDLSLANLDISDAAHWQICGQNVFAQSIHQDCDNRDHIGSGPNSGAFAGALSILNADVSDAAHWQICGQNVLVTPSQGQDCMNVDHVPANPGSGTTPPAPVPGTHHHHHGGNGDNCKDDIKK